jgi:hypothetical protein
MMKQPPFSDEEEIARLVRSTLQSATQTNNLRLTQLRPAAPRHGRRPQRFHGWQRQLAAVCTAVALCLSLTIFYQGMEQSGWQGSAAATSAATATFTSQPTVTETDTVVALTETAVALATQAAAGQKHTPMPPATPIAALFKQPLTTQNN